MSWATDNDRVYVGGQSMTPSELIYKTLLPYLGVPLTMETRTRVGEDVWAAVKPYLKKTTRDECIRIVDKIIAKEIAERQAKAICDDHYMLELRPQRQDGTALIYPTYAVFSCGLPRDHDGEHVHQIEQPKLVSKISWSRVA